MKKNKGFTLVELLVTITILGIITALAMPGVRRLTSTNSEKKFEAYEDSVIAATKVYVEDKEADLFGGAVTSKNISLDDLKKANLIKDFGDDDIECIDDSSVTVQKSSDNKYTYTANLKCYKESQVIYES